MDSKIVILLIILAVVIVVAAEMFMRLRNNIRNFRKTPKNPNEQPKKLEAKKLDPKNPKTQQPLPMPKRNQLIVEKDITFVHTNEKI
ncbi:MAG: hypothetical protein LBC41_16265 [Clostridiales bacterium]|nr:hypothetical protein [Clostridiales bacterium]MDR2752211.1 hypothetical protein [Clostridiales bacterium]